MGQHTPRKRFAQHWLRSQRTLDRIIAAAELSPRDRILEIGPGTGILTRALLPKVEAAVAVEVDRDLCEHLAKTLGKRENFLLLGGDILELDLPDLLAPFPAFHNPNKVVANIPYHITGPILERLLGTLVEPPIYPFEQIVLLVQQEVAARLCARPSTKAYGALSVRVQYLADCEYICRVPARAFQPPPKVDSAVVRLRPKSPDPAAKDVQFLASLVKAGFASRRKMLRNNLKAWCDRDRLTHFLEQLKIDPRVRAEDLSVAQWVALSDGLLGEAD